MSGTVMPSPFQTIFDANGDPVSGGLVWTYLAGTTTPQASYSDAALGSLNTNPIVADAAGRFVAYLTAGISYKFLYELAATPPAHGTVIRTVDNVSSVPVNTAAAFGGLTTTFSTSSGSYVDVPGCTATLITSGQGVWVLVTVPIANSSGTATFTFAIDGVDQGVIYAKDAIATQHTLCVSFVALLAAGSHTIKLRVKTSGTVVLDGSGVAVGVFTVVEARFS